MALFDMLQEGLNMSQRNAGASKTGTSRRNPTGFDEQATKNLAMVAIPAILWAVHKSVNADQQKQKELDELATRNKNVDPSDMTSSIEKAVPQDGKDILDKILGKDKETVTKSIASKSNVSEEEVNAVLDKITPTIVEMLQKEKDQKGVTYNDQVREELQTMEKDPEIGPASQTAKKYIEDEKEYSLSDGLSAILGSLLK